MGGSSSRFAETDWDKADGKLVSSDETIDNEPPTASYGVYFLTKLGVSQREYNVSDIDSKLLYRTRAVEGTLAWFDVMGAEQDDFKLRVQVDLSRRYWVVYNYGVPAFEGQMWDEVATERSTQRDGWRKPLFRRACITVTWSRYHAVVDLYERGEQNDKEGELERSIDGKIDEECVVNGSKGGSLLHEDESNENGVPTGSEGCDGGETIRDETEKVPELPDEVTASKVLETNDELSQRVYRSRFDAKTSIEDEFCCASEVDEPIHVDLKPTSGEENMGERSSFNQIHTDLNQNSLGESIKWAQSKVMESVAAPYRPANREEGIVTLDRPVLKVQEINSIAGKHQTMLIHSEEARRLKREELLIEAKLAREARRSSPLAEASDDDDILKDLWYQYSFNTSKSECDKSEGEGIEVVDGDTKIVDSSKVDDENDATTCNFGLVNVCSDSCLVITSSENGMGTDKKQSSTVVNGGEQPLVSFWSWENSIRVHRMKMHLARGSDLALHVVLAVITNQLRYERHATVAVAI